MRSRITVLFALGAGVLLLACGFNGVVRDRFVSDFTCPADDVHVTPRSDIHASSLLPTTPPSAEVAADPARLAEWNRQQEAVRKREDNFQVYDVTGCGHTTRYGCAQVGAGPTQADECHLYGPVTR